MGFHKLCNAPSLWQNAPHLQEGNKCHSTSLQTAKLMWQGVKGLAEHQCHEVPAEVPVSDFVLISRLWIVLDRPFQSAGLEKHTQGMPSSKTRQHRSGTALFSSLGNNLGVNTH